MKELQEEWKSLGPVPRDRAEALWQRFHGACDAFFEARKAHFARLDAERPENLKKKTALCETVEALDGLPDDEARLTAVKEAQAAWKAVGPAPKEDEQALWERFRKPIDAFFEARHEKLSEERAGRDANAAAKEDLCIEAESLRDSTDWKETIERMKALQARWKATGPAPRAVDQELWKRFRAACDGFFDRLKVNSADRAREREANLRKKQDICFMVEKLAGISPPSEGDAAESDGFDAQDAVSEPTSASMAEAESDRDGFDWKKGTDQVKALQQEWKRVGHVPREEADRLWARFQRACDAFFEERRRALGLPQEDPQANLERKLALIEEAEELLRSDAGRDEKESFVESARRDWKRIGPVPRAQSQYVWDRFNEACEGLLGKATATSVD